MDRRNASCIPRDELKWALTQPLVVRLAKRENRCLLCAAPGLNEAALCDLCSSQLMEDEAVLVEQWERGSKP